MDNNLLLQCPQHMQGPISYQRMVDPVVASDGFTYEREAIEKWINEGKTTSPMTQEEMDTTLIPNQVMKTQIQEWVEENTSLSGLQKQLKQLQGPLFTASSSKEVLKAIGLISELVIRSKLSEFCVLSPTDIQKMRQFIEFSGNLSPAIFNALNTLEQQCIANVFELQEKHSKVLKELMNLQKAKEAVLGGGGRGNKLKKNVAAAEKQKVAAEKTVEKVESALAKAKGVLDKAIEVCDEMKEPLERFYKQTSMFNDEEREMKKEEEKIKQNLLYVDKLQGEGLPSSGGSSLSATAVGSKHGRSSSSSSSSSQKSKRQKNELTEAEEEEEEEEQEKHPGQWLFEEGTAHSFGTVLKKTNMERGQIMIEASASSGWPMAKANCHYWGWNGLKQDFKKGFEMFLKIEKETNGDHWAQCMLGICYQHGKGTVRNYKKGLEFCIKSAEQGNSVAMANLGVCYEKGNGCDVNFTTSFEWYEKSAKLGNGISMYKISRCYEIGQGVTINVFKAQEWLAKAQTSNPFP